MLRSRVAASFAGHCRLPAPWWGFDGQKWQHWLLFISNSVCRLAKTRQDDQLFTDHSTQASWLFVYVQHACTSMAHMILLHTTYYIIACSMHTCGYSFGSCWHSGPLDMELPSSCRSIVLHIVYKPISTASTLAICHTIPYFIVLVLTWHLLVGNGHHVEISQSNWGVNVWIACTGGLNESFLGFV